MCYDPYNEIQKHTKNYKMQSRIYVVCIALCTSLIVSYAEAQTTYDLTEHMKYLAAREMVLSQNIANIDTPDYKPKDLIPNNKQQHGLKMSLTNPAHMQIDTYNSYSMIQGEILEIKPNGNAVTPEHELMKKNENAIKFNEISNLYNKSRQMLKVAINGSK